MNNKTKLLNCLFIGGISGLMGVNHYNVLASNQSLEVLWNKEITHNGYEGFNSVIQTKDGGFVVVGEVDSRAEGNIARGDGIIIKYDSNGEKKWQTTLEGDDTDLFYDVIESKDGNFYVIGKSFSTDVINNPNAYSNAIIVKYSPDGTMLDIKYIHDNGKQINYKEIIEIENNRLAILGNRDYNGIRKPFIDIIDSDGHVTSSHIIEDSNRDVEIESIIKTSENKLVVVGLSMENLVSRPYIAMFDTQGNKLWSYRTETDNNTDIAKIKGKYISVAEDKKGNLVVGGYYLDTGTNALVMMFDKDGNLLVNSIGENKNLQWYTSVLVNNENEMLLIGDSKLAENETLLENVKVTIDEYSNNDIFEKKSSYSLYPTFKNKMFKDAVITSSDEIVLVGESFNKVESIESKCKIADANLPDECIHSDASIVKLGFKEVEACTIIEKPQINADNKVINKGETFDVKKDVTATDAEKNDITTKIEVVSNTVDVNKEGEYLVKYKVEDKCGNISEKEIKVTVVEKKVESATDEIPDKKPTADKNNTEKPQTGDGTIIYAGLSLASSLSLLNLKRKDKK